MKNNPCKDIAIIGMPIDLGAGTQGVNLGPEAIRCAGIVERLEAIGHKVEDWGDVPVSKKDGFTVPGSNLNNYNEILKANKLLCQKVSEAMEKGKFPVILGGDHSLAIGSISGVAKNVEKLGVIWFDAHGDINTPETSPSGNIHGMPVATLLGYGDPELAAIGGENPKVKLENLVLIGCRDLDIGERKALKEKNVTVFTMHEIDDLGIKEVMNRALDIAGNGTDGIHVSFDMDAIDPEVAPGTGTKVPGGMYYRDAHYALEIIAQNANLVSLDLVEVNPLLDFENATGKLAAGLAGSLLGEWLI